MEVEQQHEQGYSQGYEDARDQYKNQEVELVRQQQEDLFNKFRLQSEDWMDKIAHDLRGEVFDVRQLKWIQKRKPQLNEDGIQLILSVISMYANKDSYLTYLDTDMINRMCRDINEELTVVFGVYGHKYGVVNRILIIDHVCNRVMISLMRAIEGRESELISKSHHHVEHEAYSTQPRGGFGKKLKGWLRSGGER